MIYFTPTESSFIHDSDNIYSSQHPVPIFSAAWTSDVA